MTVPQRFAVGVMAKAPVPGYAKTRLIPLLGAEGAATLQRELTLRTLGTACAAAPGAVSLFTAGAADDPFWSECRRSLHCRILPQHGADLGQRMARALSVLLQGSRCAVLIGTDCLRLRVADLQQAAARLSETRMVFTPAEDGGYVLVGAREWQPAAFAGIAWGEASVMADTRRALAALGWQRDRDWAELPALWDLDRPADYERAQREGLMAPEPGAAIASRT